MEHLLTIFFTIFGLLIGSFLNALIYRLPRDINIALPRSSCPNCKKIIRWYENIPILSYLFLRGKCSKCKTRISIQYPLVELLSGVVAFALAPKHLTLESVFSCVFYFSVYCVFIVHFIVDLKHQILPDSLNLYLGLLFIVFSFLSFPLSHMLLGFLIGGGFPLVVTWLFYKLRGQVGLGGGDIKLYAVLGIYLGPIGIIHNIFLSCFLGAVLGLLLMSVKIIKRDNPIPFGPFIILVATVQIFMNDIFQELVSYMP